MKGDAQLYPLEFSVQGTPEMIADFSVVMAKLYTDADKGQIAFACAGGTEGNDRYSLDFRTEAARAAYARKVQKAVDEFKTAALPGNGNSTLLLESSVDTVEGEVVEAPKGLVAQAMKFLNRPKATGASL